MKTISGANFLFTLFTFFATALFAQEKERDHTLLSHLLNLLQRDSTLQIPTCRALEQTQDRRVAPALIEMLRFAKLPRACDWALARLTGKSFGSDWPAWMEWLGKQQLEPHPAYPAFKQELFGRIDPAFAKFLHPQSRRTIRLDEVVWGGVKKDGIPALDHPKMIPAAAAKFLDDDDEIFGIEINGVQQAYPLRILNWHEMLNTVIDGKAVTLTYCTLCGAAVLYDPTFNGCKFDFT